MRRLLALGLLGFLLVAMPFIAMSCGSDDAASRYHVEHINGVECIVADNGAMDCHWPDSTGVK